MINNFAKQQAALLIGGSSVPTPTYFVIGSGSGTIMATQTTLFNEYDRQLMTSRDLSVGQQVTFTGDWNSVEISGLTLTEFGVIGSAAPLVGSIWSVISLPGITFNGTQELRIEEVHQIY